MPVAASLFFGVLLGADLYEAHHPADFYQAQHSAFGEADAPWWTGVFYLGGVLNLWWWLGLARLIAPIAAGAVVGSWWALPIAALMIPEIEIVRAADETFYGPGPLPASAYVGQTVLFGAFIAFGASAASPRLRARLRGIRNPDHVERFKRHPYPQGYRGADDV
jgi:hypothetical protein